MLRHAIKSANEGNHIANLEEAFDNLCHHQMKLNLNKCTLKVMVGKFLNFIVTALKQIQIRFR